MEFTPCLTRSVTGGGIEVITLGHPLLDDYLALGTLVAGLFYSTC